MRVGTMFGLSLTALAALALAAVVIPACTPTETAGPGLVDAGPTMGGFCGTAKAMCCAPAGEIPNPECDDGDETQCAATATCPIASTCGSTSTCLPLADNGTNTVQNFRMRRLIVAAPSALANPAVQNLVVTGGVDMNEKQCGEEGTGDFNWLLSFDTVNNTLTTGGAPACDTTDTVAANGFPACDPIKTGYCFVNKIVPGSPTSIAVGPATVDIVKAADGTWGTKAPIPILNIPIYIGVPPAVIVLPISSGVLAGVSISPDGNCIGSFNAKALDSTCADNYTACSKWLTAGSLAGYLTLETADTVFVALENETLCSLLTGDTSGSYSGFAGAHACSRDANGKITDKGDYCSTTQAAGGCQDSFWLAATFAASAVKIDTTGTSNPDCMGGTDAGSMATDAGTDSGAAADSGAADSGASDAAGD